MAIKKLTSELAAGEIVVGIVLSEESGGPLLTALVQRIEELVAQQRPGSEFEGVIRQAEDQSSSVARFGESWSSDDAREILDQLHGFQALIAGDFSPGSALQVEDSPPSGGSRPSGPSVDEPRPIDGELPVVDRSGWIRELASGSSKAATLLAEQSIESDSKYLEIEERFTAEERMELAEFRFRYGMRQSSNEEAPGGTDLQVLSVFMPPWISSIPFGLKGFPTRGRNSLPRAGIKTFDELSRVPLEKMMRIETFGKNTYQKIGEVFTNELLDHAEAQLADPGKDSDRSFELGQRSRSDFSSFEGLWSEVLRLVAGDAEKEILTRRIGVGRSDGGETLEEIGKSRGVCRERIRQVQARAVMRLREDPSFRNLRSNLESEIESRIRWSGGPIMLGEKCVVPSLRGATFRTVKQFFQLILGSDYKVLISQDEDGGETARILFGMSEDELRDALNSLKEFILAHREDPRSIFIPEVEQYITGNHHESIHSDLKAFVDEWINWDYSSDPRIISFGDSIEAAAAAVLERATRPLKISELIEIARNDFALDQGEGSIRNAVGILCRSPGESGREEVAVAVFQIGRSEFTTARHLPIDLEQTACLAPVLRDLIVNGREGLIPGEPYQWHTLDLWKELAREVPGNELANMDEKIAWRAVDWLLRYHAPSGIVNLMKGRWAKKVQGLEQKARTFEQGLVLVLEEYFPNHRGTRKDVLEKLEEIQSLGFPKVIAALNPPLAVDQREIWLVGS
ncbi:hypothetical protein HFP89_08130 [Wenzhouxiangella sp. XN79A]|uniref:sigma factor-like helix-turn-helix DNA-binding protein n=1 Tax=Wenzhouxiangella sp. XN79A TaxID=2724193 RepID=UPI00144AE056|nr:sigma factor-like helix-turn-helix DNA-binding protein [Wenzhouxiangella sp. XN79A]NKI35132.1 hypothetical protein [Wenzhouxiangella sp. XN79A]